MPFTRAASRSRAPAAPYQLVGPVGTGEISTDSSSSMMSASPQLAITDGTPGPTFTGPASGSAQPAFSSPAQLIQFQSPTVAHSPAVIHEYALTVAHPPAGPPPGLTVADPPADQDGGGSSHGRVPTVAHSPAAQGPWEDPNSPHFYQQNIHQTAVDASHDVHMNAHVEFHEQLNQQVNVQQVHLQGFTPDQVAQVVDQRDRTHAAELCLVQERAAVAAAAMATAAVAETRSEAERLHHDEVARVERENEARLLSLQQQAHAAVVNIEAQRIHLASQL